MSAIIAAIIGGIFSVICALIAKSGPRRQNDDISSRLTTTQERALPSSPARWLSWIACVAWILPLLGFPFSLLALGFAIRDSRADVRRVPKYVVPIALITLALTILNAIWGAYQAAHGCQFYQPAAGCH
jgi:hypothetical protein